MDKRFTELTDPSQPPLGISPAGSILWCTGKDSNLRTSLGGTDLQSVGFNHSPTCAKTLGRCGHCAPSGKLRYWGRSKAQTRKPRPNAAHSTLYFRNTGKPRLAQERPRRSLHTGKVPNGVRWKNLLRRYRVRRLPENTFPGAGEGI